MVPVPICNILVLYRVQPKINKQQPDTDKLQLSWRGLAQGDSGHVPLGNIPYTLETNGNRDETMQAKRTEY